MYIQEQLPYDQINDDTLSFFKAIGVDYLTVNSAPPGIREGEDLTEYWGDLRLHMRR